MAVDAVKPKPTAAECVADIRRRIERVPVGEARTILELKFADTVQTLARKIRDAARRPK